MRSKLEYENELNAAKTEFDKETVKLKRIEEIENELLYRQKKNNLHLLHELRAAKENNERYNSTRPPLAVSCQLFQYLCFLSTDALIAALEVQTKIDFPQSPLHNQ
jgi:hypothetical protein